MVAPLWGPGRAVSRILFPVNRAAIIHLGRRLPAASSDLPGSIGRAALKRFPIRSCSGWVYLASRVTTRTGELLPHPFTLTSGIPGGGLLSVALALGLPPPGVTRHPALRSSDFPPALTRAGDRLAAPDTGPYMPTAKKKQAVLFIKNP